MSATRAALIQQLAQRIQEIEGRKPGIRSQGSGVRSQGSGVRDQGSGVSNLTPDSWLLTPDSCSGSWLLTPDPWLGSFVELCSAADGAGSTTLALHWAGAACTAGKVLVVIDGKRSFYPPAAAKFVDLARCLILRPRTRPDAYAATVWSLRCAAVGAVMSWCDRLNSCEGRRLQLAAETGGGLGILLRPATALHTPSFAALRLLVTPVRSQESGVRSQGSGVRSQEQGPVSLTPDSWLLTPDPWLRRISVEVMRSRWGISERSLILEIDDETGHVRVPTEVAASTAPARTARAFG